MLMVAEGCIFFAATPAVMRMPNPKNMQHV